MAVTLIISDATANELRTVLNAQQPTQPPVQPPAQPPAQPPVQTPTQPPNGMTGTMITLPWGADVHHTESPFLPPQVLVVRFKTPKANTPMCKISVAEFGSATSYRDFCLSETAGDFTNSVGRWASGSAPVPVVPFSVGPNDKGAPQLKQGTLYYFNLRNSANCNCASSKDCSIRVSLDGR